MAMEKWVRLATAHYEKETGRITVRPVLSYLIGAPLGLAELSEDEALDLAQSLIMAVQTRRQEEARRQHRKVPPEIL